MNRKPTITVSEAAYETIGQRRISQFIGEQRKAMADQIATVSKQRLKSKLGTLAADEVRALERAIRGQLGL